MPMTFFCAKHNLHGFFGLYNYCPLRAGVSPALLAATRAQRLRELSMRK